MYSSIGARSEFYGDEERRKEACAVLAEMKKMRERLASKIITIKLPNGVIVSSTNPDRLKEYEEYYKRKSRHYNQPK